MLEMRGPRAHIAEKDLNDIQQRARERETDRPSRYNTQNPDLAPAS